MNKITDFINTNKGVLIVAVFTVTMVSLIASVQPVDAVLDPYLGEIRFFAGTFAPRGWALCDGQLLPVAQNDALFSLFGTNYGGDGRTTFALPDMRGRVMIDDGTGPGLSPRIIGSKGGSETATLTTNNLPSHFHSLGSSLSPQLKAAFPGTDVLPGFLDNTKSLGITAARLYSSQMPSSVMHSDSISIQVGGALNEFGEFTNPATANTDSAGGGQPHNNMAPFNNINCIVALQGIYPSRN